MNKSGSVIIFTMMLGMTIIIVALALAPPVQEVTEAAMNATVGDTFGLDCSNESISSFNKATCIATDLSMFYFLGALIFIGGFVLTVKVRSG